MTDVLTYSTIDNSLNVNSFNNQYISSTDNNILKTQKIKKLLNNTTMKKAYCMAINKNGYSGTVDLNTKVNVYVPTPPYLHKNISPSHSENTNSYLVDNKSCKDPKCVTNIPNTKFDEKSTSMKTLDKKACISDCLNNSKCYGVTHNYINNKCDFKDNTILKGIPFINTLYGDNLAIHNKFGFVGKQATIKINKKNAPGIFSDVRRDMGGDVSDKSICDVFIGTYCDNVKQQYKNINGGKYNHVEFTSMYPECSCYGDVNLKELANLQGFKESISRKCYMVGCVDSTTSPSYVSDSVQKKTCPQTFCANLINVNHIESQKMKIGGITANTQCGGGTHNKNNTQTQEAEYGKTDKNTYHSESHRTDTQDKTVEHTTEDEEHASSVTGGRIYNGYRQAYGSDEYNQYEDNDTNEGNNDTNEGDNGTNEGDNGTNDNTTTYLGIGALVVFIVVIMIICVSLVSAIILLNK